MLMVENMPLYGLEFKLLKIRALLKLKKLNQAASKNRNIKISAELDINKCRIADDEIRCKVLYFLLQSSNNLAIIVQLG